MGEFEELGGPAAASGEWEQLRQHAQKYTLDLSSSAWPAPSPAMALSRI